MPNLITNRDHINNLLTSTLILITACVAFYIPTSKADDLLFVPRATLSVASYKFTQSSRPGALAPTGINGDEFPEVEFNVTFKLLGAGATLVKDTYYLDLLYQQSLKEEDTFEFSDPSSGVDFKETFEGDRKDYAITLGKKILDQRGGVYIGYKVGKSEADGDQGEHLLFKEKGFFIGGNYGVPISDYGVLSFNLAYAVLEGELKEDVNDANFPGVAVPLDTDATSDAKGLSYGISWSSSITDNFSYSLGLDVRKYTFTNVEDSNPNAIPSDEFKEEFISGTLALYYLF